MQAMRLAIVFLLALLFAQGTWAEPAAIELDGKLAEAAWSDAFVVTDWLRVEPFARDTPRYRNEARVLATRAGLAVGFVLEHPASERRVKPQTARDALSFVGESVSFIVDVEGTGHAGYEFSVGLGGGVRDGLVINQNEFDRDWDGQWWRALHETEDHWSVEILIPWSTLRARDGTVQTRSIRVYFERELHDRSERFAFPGINYDNVVFLSDFQSIEITHYADGGGRLNIAPYATVLNDGLRDEMHAKAGGEIFWRPSSKLHAVLTLNPDFGQVESDELVVDFSAIETLFTDKRPFFTEDQAVFDVRTPANGQFVYTRRIGAARDDAMAGSSDIAAALKLTGEAAGLKYGFIAAQEDDYSKEIGRRFAVTRLLLPGAQQRLAYLSTWAERPFLERDALINEFDYEYIAHPWWRLSAQAARSDIEQQGADTTGYLASMQVDLNRSGDLMHTAKVLYIDDAFDMNDLGYMERNSLRQIEWETTLRQSYDPQESTLSGALDRVYVFYRENAAGERLPSRLQLVRDVQFRNGWSSYHDLRYFTSGVDDLISRGNGPVRQDARFAAFVDGVSPRYGDWQYLAALYGYQQGVDDFSAWLQLGVTWFARQSLTLGVDVIPAYSADWLIWSGRENLFGGYQAQRLDMDFRLDWFPAPRHEIRLRWQWIGIDAEPDAAYRTRANGELFESADELTPFTVNHLGLQVRYRYEFAPLSELFIVYSRGGFNFQDAETRQLGRLFKQSVDLRDADQFLVKLRFHW